MKMILYACMCGGIIDIGVLKGCKFNEDFFKKFSKAL